jgi:hypothetical protein
MYKPGNTPTGASGIGVGPGWTLTVYVLPPSFTVSGVWPVNCTMMLAAPWLMVPPSMPLNVKVVVAADAVSVSIILIVNGLLENVLGWVGSTALKPMLEVRLMSEDPLAEPADSSKKITLFVPPSAAKTWGIEWVA